MTTKRTGNYAEEMAMEYLTTQGLKPVTRNYHCRHGEIDLIMEDNDTLVFVEVRYRARTTGHDYGGALQSVDKRKQTKLIKTALHYLQRHNHAERDARIDVVALQDLTLSDNSIIWIQNAIETMN